METTNTEYIRTRQNDLVAIRLGFYGGAISLDMYRTLRHKLLRILSYWRGIERRYG